MDLVSRPNRFEGKDSPPTSLARSRRVNQEEAFLADIAEHPDDDGPRLIFADWLEDHGQPERAEFIRVQVELEPFRDRYGGRRATELRQRERQLCRGHPWLWDMPQGWDGQHTGLSLRFRRGFPDLLRGPAQSFPQFGAEIRARQPTIRRVVVHWLNSRGEALAACAGLAGLAELELACWYAETDLEALARSPHLAGLEVLVLWLGRQEGGSDEDLVRIAAGARAWPKLRELVLFDPRGASEQESEPLVAEANRRAGRQIARYERGDRERLPFDEMLGWGFLIGGWLPDGRAALAELDVDFRAHYDTIPSALAVRTFGGQGVPTGEVIRVPLPPELAKVKWCKADNRDGRYTQHLRDALGFEPGLVRVPPCALGERLSFDGFSEDWATCGASEDPPEDDQAIDYSRWVNGFGGRLYWYLRGEEFVVGFKSRADQRNEDSPELPPPEDDLPSEDELPF